MKKLLIALSLVALSTSALAHERGGYRGGYHGYYHGGGCYGCGWVAPALIGGVIGYELAQPRVIYEQAPVVIQQPPVVYQQAPTTTEYSCPVGQNPVYFTNGVFAGCK
jgi:hypothetical protein